MLEYLNFDLTIIPDRRSKNRYQARVSYSPTGENSQDFALDINSKEWFHLLDQLENAWFDKTSTGNEAMQIGQKLYNTVFDVNIRSLFEASRQRARAEGKRLRIRLCLTEVPELARLPWESMYNTSSEHFFACSIETPIVRYLATSYDNGQRNTTLPLRMLVISASPRNFDAKDIEQQWRTIQSSVRVLQDQGVLHVEYLRDITIQRLQARLRREKYDIIHFIGHGEFNDSSQNGTLFFLTDQGNVKTVTGNVLGALLYDAAPTLRLVILNACDGARANSRSNPLQRWTFSPNNILNAEIHLGLLGSDPYS